MGELGYAPRCEEKMRILLILNVDKYDPEHHEKTDEGQSVVSRTFH